jgi:putative SOS response-associated peptidase YedK
MCGRFALHHGAEELRARFAVEQMVADLAPRYNIAPTQPVAVVLQRELRVLDRFRWGLVPFWAKDPKIGSRMINARSESVAEKPAYRGALGSRRCLIPASGFYEWKRRGEEKIPTYVHRADGRPFAMAGLWERWSAPDDHTLHTCAILTTRASEFMADIHDRMPVILTPDQERAWLDSALGDPGELVSLLQPYEADDLAAYPVSREVNAPAHDAPDCIAPVEAV